MDGEGVQIRAGLKRRFLRMMRPPRRVYPTKAGLFVLGAPIVLGVAAVTASNNLLFLLLGGMLGAIVLSGLLSQQKIRGLSVKVRALSVARAMEPTRLSVEISRDAFRADAAPIFSLVLTEDARPGWRWALRARPPRDPHKLSVAIPVIDGPSATQSVLRSFGRRGPARLGPCELWTRYPFGLLMKTRDVDLDVEVLVGPRRVALPPLLSDPRGLAQLGEDAEQRGRGLEIYGLRERELRDAPHRVHALRSLSLGRDVVLEMAGSDRPQAEIGVANVVGADGEAFERSVELCAEAIEAWIALGFTVGLRTSTSHYPGTRHAPEALVSVLARLELESPRVTEGWRPPKASCVWLIPHGVRLEAQDGESAQSGRRFSVGAGAELEALR
ncbi:MAG: hypothetical protein IPK13_17775 [Deltaproteobacteria bacterium]|nr:hypothetical protein [Deltaproteobacteria bacterium]